MYTVGRASELTGIPSETLRKWEQRYGVVAPARSDGNYRLYDDRALRRLAAMRALVDSGWSPREAATRVLADESGPAGATEGEDPALRGLARAAETLDVGTLRDVLADGFAGGDLAHVVDEWLLPSLARVGTAWREGRVTIAGEHFVSAGVQRRLAATFDAFPPPATSAAHVLVGLARGSRHELGVLAFAGVMREAGLRVTYVGSDLPGDAWLSTVRSLAPDAVVIGVPIEEDVPAVREVVSALTDHTPDVVVCVGGAHQHRIERAHRLGHVVGAAAADLAARLTPRG